MSGEYWYNIETHEVEEGRRSDWSKVMGPYPSREAATHALDTARARTQKWEDEERENR